MTGADWFWFVVIMLWCVAAIRGARKDMSDSGGSVDDESPS